MEVSQVVRKGNRIERKIIEVIIYIDKREEKKEVMEKSKIIFNLSNMTWLVYQDQVVLI